MVARRLMRWIKSLVVLIVLLIVGVISFIYSGFYNVAADYADNPVVERLLSATADRSIKRHAGDIRVPALDDPAMIREGARHYKGDCAVCHGAPGIEIGEIGQGLNPKPPKLTETAGEWQPNELFWITKHGIRMTGMPAWGKVEPDDELRNVVAFVRAMPGMTLAQYKELTGEDGAENGSH